jgi:rRNA-processing protein FCF1
VQEEEAASGVKSPLEQAVLSFSHACDERLLFVLDTNIFLDKSNFINLSVWNKAKWDKLERDNRHSSKIYIPQVVFEELDQQRKGKGNMGDSVPVRARAVMRFLEDKFKSSATAPQPSSLPFWELQDRDVDILYRSKIGSSAGNRTADMRIFYFVRDTHRRRPGSVTLVTNDQPLSLEAASVGVRTISSLQLFAKPACLVREPAPVPETQSSLATVECAVMGDDDCVVTKVTRADDPVVYIEVLSDEDSESAPPATQALAAPVQSEVLRGSQNFNPVQQVNWTVPVESQSVLFKF